MQEQETNIPSTSSKSWGWLKAAAILALIVIAAVIFMKNKKPANQTATGQKTPVPELKVETKQVSANKLPDSFPSNIPMEAGAKITQNYNATTNDGRVQATRVFESSKTAAENLKIYSAFFSAGGWSVTSTLDSPTVPSKAVAAANGKLTAVVSIAPASGGSTVSISIVTAK